MDVPIRVNLRGIESSKPYDRATIWDKKLTRQPGERNRLRRKNRPGHLPKNKQGTLV
jgi:hypothetical protein